jgi:non-canonical (house-cleaning) NTP pyrophosphatase
VEISTKNWIQQPVGFGQTLLCAKNRAEIVRLQYPEALCLGIESGLIQAHDVTTDTAVIAALTPDGSWFFGTSPGITLPERYVQEAKRRGFKTTTVGEVVAESLRGDPTDPHASLTSGIINRRYVLFCGVYILFLQLRGLGLL